MTRELEKKRMSEVAEKRGAIFIVSAPSGSGKSTLVKRVMERISGLRFSVSHTTRPPRAGEVNGMDYFFVERKQFEEMIREDRFVEHATVFGNYYGTAWHEIEAAQQSGDDVLLDIDVQGAGQVKQRFGAEATSVFVLPPSYQVLEQRLRTRNSDGDAVIERRLQNARREIQEFEKYDYVIINDDVTRAAGVLESIIQAQRAQQRRMKQQVLKIIQTFGGISE